MNIRQNSQNIHFIAMLLILTFFFYSCSNTQEENQTYQNNSENKTYYDTRSYGNINLEIFSLYCDISRQLSQPGRFRKQRYQYSNNQQNNSGNY